MSKIEPPNPTPPEKIRVDIASLRAAMLKARSSVPERAPPRTARIQHLENRAALLAWFSPADLTAPDPPSAEDPELNGVLAKSDWVSLPEGARRSLQLHARREILLRLKTRAAMIEALSGMTLEPRDPLQAMFTALIRDEAIRLGDLDRSQLGALLVVRAWLDGILAPLPDLTEIRARLAHEDLLAPLRDLVRGFAGRDRELNQLRAYTGMPVESGWPRPFSWISRLRRTQEGLAPVFIHGIGGVGKSTLAARIALDFSAMGGYFVFLDVGRHELLDGRGELDARLPMALLTDATRQLGAQAPAAAPAAVKLAEDIATAVAAAAGARSDEAEVVGTTERTPAARFVEFVRQYFPVQNLLFVIDTFEQVQMLGMPSVRRVCALLGELQHGLGKLRVVICGRALPASEVLSSNEVLLEEFDSHAALGFLSARVPRSSTDLEVIVGGIERTPMALLLAAKLLSEGHLDELPTGKLTNLIRARQSSAYLYARVLEHMHPPELQRLAKPGLIVRRVTPQIIKDVLAGPCGLHVPDMATARDLFEKLSVQTSLVDHDGVESLRHRGDVRTRMLAAVESDTGHDVVAEIDRKSVTFNEARGDVISRAEELYHRLRLGELKEFERRWRDDAAPLLFDAIEEFSARRPAAAVALAARLNVALDPDTMQYAGQAERERALQLESGPLIRDGSFNAAIDALRRQPERLGASPLYRLEAEAWMGLGQYEEAERVAKRGVEAAEQFGGNIEMFDNAFVAARAAAALGHPADALLWLESAQATARRMRSAERMFRVAFLQASLRGPQSSDAERLTLRRMAEELFYQPNGAVREDAAAVGDASLVRAASIVLGGSSAVAQLALRRFGIDNCSAELRAELAGLLWRIAGRAATTADASSARAILAAVGADLPADGEPVHQWSAWMARYSDSAIGTALADLLATHPSETTRQQIVDWTDHYFRAVSLPSTAAAPQTQAVSLPESISGSSPMPSSRNTPPTSPGADDPAERGRVDLDALQVLAGAELAQRRLLAGLSMGTPSFERSTYLIKTRIKEHSKIVDKVFARRKNRPDYQAMDVSDVLGLRILTLYRSDLPGLLQRFLKFVEQASREPLDLFPSGIQDAVEEVILYGYPQQAPLCKALISQLRDVGLDLDGKRYRYVHKDNGYSSIHLCLHAQASTGEKVLRVPLEVQIRTVLEDAWGEVEHELVYKSQMWKPDPSKKGLMVIAENQLLNWKTQLDNSGSFADNIKELIKEIFSTPTDLSQASYPSVDDEELRRLQLPTLLQRRVDEAVARIGRFFSDQRNPAKVVPTEKLVAEMSDIAIILQEVLEKTASDPSAQYWLTMEAALCLLQLGRLLRERTSPGQDQSVFEGIRQRLQAAHVLPAPKSTGSADQAGRPGPLDARSAYTFGTDALDEAASRYFAVESTHPEVPLIAYRLGEVFSAQGEAEMALAKFEEAFRLMKTASVSPRMRVQIPRRLGFAYWEAAENLRRRAKSVRNPDFALHKRREQYLLAIEYTQLAYEAAKEAWQSGAGSARPEDRDTLEWTVNNLLNYCTEFLRAKGQLSELEEKRGLNSKALQELLDELLPNGTLQSATDPGLADTVRDAARYFGNAELERAAARRVTELLDSRDWRHRYKPEVIADMGEDAEASLARLS